MTDTGLLSDIGSKVRARRTRMGWTLKDIADRSGVSCRFLTDLEAGRGNISIVRLSHVARALDVPLMSLFPTEEHDHHHIITLVGLRGAGKTTIGQALARTLKVPFIELDSLIEEQANLSLSELFALHGEAYYKRIAYDVLLKMVGRDERVVAAVESAVVTDPESWHLLKHQTHTIWLKASPEDHWKRVLGQEGTDQGNHRHSAITELRSIIAQRTLMYSEAAQTIDTSALGVSEAVGIIADAIRRSSEREQPRPRLARRHAVQSL
jgi:XRE family aerobic/anaerobic benzoate catabolism transcriptional regulator